MGSNSTVIVKAICLFFLLGLVVELVEGGGTTFNVKQNGAKADGKTDDSKAIASAWKQACQSANPSTVVIPAGTYLVGPLKFQGPCKAKQVEIQVQGTLKAPADPQKLKSQDGWVIFQNIAGLTLSGGGIFDGQGQLAWQQNDCAKTGKCSSLPINLRFTTITNSLIRDITSKDSKLFHMNILGCKNMTLQHITIDAPVTSLNTDGIHIGRSTGINITDAKIKTGDDCVSMGDGCQQVHVEKVTCGPGHGISVGSLGKYQNEQDVIGITVTNCTFTDTMNGVRVKTWPASPNGVASDMHFEDLIMNNVSTPILIDQQYCPYSQCEAKIPSRVKISNVSFKKVRGTSATQLAVKVMCSKGIPCQNLELSDINLTYNGKDGQAMSQCANVKPKLTGKLFPPPCMKLAPPP